MSDTEGDPEEHKNGYEAEQDIEGIDDIYDRGADGYDEDDAPKDPDGDEEDDEEDDSESVAEDKLVTPTHKRMRIPDDKRRTSDMLSVSELSAIVGSLAKSIEKNEELFISKKSAKGLRSAIALAKQHVRDRKVPFKLRRNIGEDYYEEWDINTEMIFPRF